MVQRGLPDLSPHSSLDSTDCRRPAELFISPFSSVIVLILLLRLFCLLPVPEPALVTSASDF